MSSWKLEDAAQIKKSAPYTFYRPSDAVIEQLLPGKAIVKLIFSFESDDPHAPSAERMWVIMDAIDDQGNYTGTLDNDPLHIQDLKAGDRIVFGKNHIIQYDTLDELSVEDDGDEEMDRYLMRSTVSNQILQDGLPVNFIYRELPKQENDSGWHFMSGKETDEYCLNQDNFQYIAIGVVLNKDDTFISLLDATEDSAFARNEITGKFFTVKG